MRLKEAIGHNFEREFPFFYYGNVLSRIDGDVEVIEIGTVDQKDRINIYEQKDEITGDLLIHDVRLLVKSLEEASGEVELMATYSCEVERKQIIDCNARPFKFVSPSINDYFELSLREAIRNLGSNIYDTIKKKNEEEFRRAIKQ